MWKVWKRRTTEDWIVDGVIYLTCLIILIVTVYPFYYVLIVSFNEGIDASMGGIYWWPRKFTLENYAQFFGDLKWLRGLGVTVLRTVVGTVIGVLFTTLVAYGLSFQDLCGRKIYMTIIIISMYFSGGIIPYYMLLRELHLVDTFFVYVIPGALNSFFLMVGLSFFSDIPSSLRESAKIDGASELTVFAKIILPISKPFLATLALYIGVGHWNNWYDSAFFVKTKELRTLSYLMMEVINKSLVSSSSAAAAAQAGSATTTLSIQTAAMVIAVAPILCVYPFLQKYFVTGIMIGSVKE
ncbi:MAG: carbohydrate ABC transporter permease [Eubacteriales bacterium]|nr:carbohydrate ABC transporter permease [Eubacteriales bacterium]